eukprot:CAMPEP_0114330600 /NCGR_PEP_ID=MMETSP0101-20121206/1867_1 /TAXON_ID=38822 ORGANISM="Pteridomonas danica, Strain PT" /NCGR_SAMPLE_ID=MMETSP0101 /ASSEMBLY_ACC=CAM_ASM_000211 /LENGTH=256 /DNA_ID=CAMNT_0001460681 /DNA_START=1703 /DNA_END=2470 /DNA_ORIENTATION=+
MTPSSSITTKTSNDSKKEFYPFKDLFTPKTTSTSVLKRPGSIIHQQRDRITPQYEDNDDDNNDAYDDDYAYDEDDGNEVEGQDSTHTLSSSSSPSQLVLQSSTRSLEASGGRGGGGMLASGGISSTRNSSFSEVLEVGRFAKILSAQWYSNQMAVRRRRDVFGDRSLSIEVQFGEYGLVRVFFPKPALCSLLSPSQKEKLYESLDYTLDDAQILREYFRLCEDFTDHLQSKQSISGNNALVRFRFAHYEVVESLPW